jgi:hypothetical protein
VHRKFDAPSCPSAELQEEEEEKEEEEEEEERGLPRPALAPLT